jgi:glutaredoxin
LGEIILKRRGHAVGDVGDACQLTPQASLVYFALPMELKLYSRAWCSWCIDAKDYLSEKGYSFQEIDVGKDRAAYEHMKKLSAQTYVPTFVAGDKVLANFDTDQLEKFLTEHQIQP